MIGTLKQIAIDVIAGKSVISEDELRDERLKVCEACEHFEQGLRRCSICHCFMDVKTKFVAAECPINKW